MNCDFCGELVRAGHQTCGDSYCQEAAYYRNAFRLAKGRARRAARELAEKKARVADEMGQRRKHWK